MHGAGMKYRTLFTLQLVLIAGCASSSASSPTSARSSRVVPPVRVLNSAFQEQIEHDGSLTFRSWNGRRLGMDDDTELRFLPNAKVEMIEYGFGVRGYRGTYQLDDAGKLTTDFEQLEHPWPAMLLERDDKSLILLRGDGMNVLPTGGHTGAILPDGAGKYWPFRMVPSSQRHTE